MTPEALDQSTYLSQLRLLLEELCCDLCRFEHVINDGLRPEAVRIDREVCLGAPNAFADIRVTPSGLAPYFVEIKFGYSNDVLVRHLSRKYAKRTEFFGDISQIILVIDQDRRPDGGGIEAQLGRHLDPHLKLEIWNEQHLLRLLHDRFHVDLPAITAENLLE